MTTFIVDGKETEIRYDYNGIDISGDFIGNTSHGMEINDEGNYIATPEEYTWWGDVIDAHQAMDVLIAEYKFHFGSDEVSAIVEDNSDADYELHPAQVINALETHFGKI